MVIACSLSSTALAARRERWIRLIARSGLGRDETPDGLRLRFRADPEAAAELGELAAAERECCAWADWSVEPGAGEVALVVRSTGDGVTALHTMFSGV
jgi:MerR family transcriptional regulator, copper efflux regulator